MHERETYREKKLQQTIFLSKTLISVSVIYMPKKQVDTITSTQENKLTPTDSNVSFDFIHYKATPVQVLSADIILLVLSAIMFYIGSSKCISFLGSLREYLKLVYEGFKTGRFHYDCTIGGSAIQIAECQIYHGFNVFLFYTVTYFLEYTSLIFRGSNVVEVFGRVAGLFYMLKLMISSIPFVFLLKLFRTVFFVLRQAIVFVIVRVSPCQRE